MSKKGKKKQTLKKERHIESINDIFKNMKGINFEVFVTNSFLVMRKKHFVKFFVTSFCF